MKLKLTTLFAILLLGSTALAEDLLRITCRSFAGTQLQAEIGAIKMAASISKEAEQVSLTSKEAKTDEGQTFWIAEMIIRVSSKQLTPPAPQKSKPTF